MAPKNKKKNSFYFFMKEMQEAESRKGRRISMINMANLAHPIWAKMSLEEKQPYEEEALRCKNDPTLRGGRLASDGTPIEEGLRQINELERIENEMKQAIKNLINADCISKEHFKEFAQRKLFYFVSFNLLCQTENEYLPNEIAIVEFSIMNGIHRKFHKLIYPGYIPSGYTGEAKRLMEKHEIDMYGEKESERNLSQVLKDIKTFIDPENSGQLSPLFCLKENIELNQGCLDWLSAAVSKKERKNMTYFDVWNAVYLLLELRNGIDDPLPSEHIATEFLTKTSFLHSDSNSRCNFHEEKDNPYCALAMATQLGYLMADSVCESFDITPTKAHLPEMSLEEKSYTIIEPRDSYLFNTNKKHNQPSRPQSEASYYTAHEEDTFSDITSVVSSNASTLRQPSSTCLAKELSRLNIKVDQTTNVPGHVGIGRGRRPPQQ